MFLRKFGCFDSFLVIQLKSWQVHRLVKTQYLIEIWSRKYSNLFNLKLCLADFLIHTVNFCQSCHSFNNKQNFSCKNLNHRNKYSSQKFPQSIEVILPIYEPQCSEESKLRSETALLNFCSVCVTRKKQILHCALSLHARSHPLVEV